MPRTESVVEIEGRHLKLSNLAKVMYPEIGFTKAQVIDYYVRIAPALLPHLRDRPLTMKRYPGGVTGQFFYEKNCPTHRPEWVQTASVWSPGNNKWMKYCMVQDLPTLVWAANLADIELHTSLSLANDVLRPTMIVFDLDPGEPANIVQCCQVGVWVRRIFDHFGMHCFPKTSGSKGLQIYVPLHTPVTYDETKPFAHELARMLERTHTDLVVSDMKKALRVGKIFVDWSQNDDYKTTVCVYSLRAKNRPTVSTPVTWEEVEECLRRQDPGLLVFDSDQVLDRVQKSGDLFEPVLKLKQKLPAIGALSDAASVVGGTASARPATQAKRTASAEERKLKHTQGRRKVTRPKTERAA
ncbi:MAG TPA: non-homologous end-joining DNA ligase [Terriglobales bacterium]|nr:non-homologous end-joining DNA ligase [Terriglobales bacterium]